MSSGRTKKLKKVKKAVLNLKQSPLYPYRKKNNYYPVIGQGSHFAEIVFIGEAPGRNEAETGRPFCGAAGRILDQLLESIKIDRKDVYITNILKDRPPNNRDPKPEEIEVYTPFLVEQLKIIKPKLIATLGRFAMTFVLKHFGLEDKLKTISQLHGQIFETQTTWGKLKIVPLYHPAVAIYNPNMLPELKKDFQLLKKFKAKKTQV